MTKVHLFYILLGISLLCSGCKEEYPVYATAKKGKAETFPCLNYLVLNPDEKNRLQHAFGIEEDPQCIYRVELIQYKVAQCSNPVVKSVGSDFNGYVRVEVKKGFSTLYKVQSDYKFDREAAFERVLENISKTYRQVE